jgi:hypothetical protein
MDKPKTPLLKRPLIRVLVIWAIQTVALLIMARLMNGVALDNLIAGIVTHVPEDVINPTSTLSIWGAKSHGNQHGGTASIDSYQCAQRKQTNAARSSGTHFG